MERSRHSCRSAPSGTRQSRSQKQQRSNHHMSAFLSISLADVLRTGDPVTPSGCFLGTAVCTRMRKCTQPGTVLALGLMRTSAGVWVETSLTEQNRQVLHK